MRSLTDEQILQRNQFYSEIWPQWEPVIKAFARNFASKTLLPEYDFSFFFSKGQEYLLYAAQTFDKERGPFLPFARRVLRSNLIVDLQRSYARKRIARARTLAQVPNPEDPSLQEVDGEFVVVTPTRGVVEVLHPECSLYAEVPGTGSLLLDLVPDRSPSATEGFELEDAVQWSLSRLLRIPTEQAAIARTILSSAIEGSYTYSNYRAGAQGLGCSEDLVLRALKLLRVTLLYAFHREYIPPVHELPREARKRFILRFLQQHATDGVTVQDIACAVVDAHYVVAVSSKLCSSIVSTISDLRRECTITRVDGRYFIS